MSKKKTKEEFIAEAKEVHIDENLDYSKVIYKNNRTPVCIIDHDLREDGTEYGEFWQTPNSHLNGAGHPDKKGWKIHNKMFSSFDEIKKRIIIGQNNELLDFSKSVYVNIHTPISVIDHSLDGNGDEYGEYEIEPNSAIKGCYPSYKSKRDYCISFLKNAKKVHPDNMDDYSEVEYVNYDTNVKIICKIHGPYWQSPANHLVGCRCPMCNGGYKLTIKEIIKRSVEIHGDQDEYHLITDYKDNKTPIPFVCKKHGIYWQSVDKHLAGERCPTCSTIISKNESEITNYLKTLIGEDNVKVRDREILNKKEIDIYIPSKKLAIEYDGLIWHSGKCNKGITYHLDKTEKCKEQGIRLIHIFEDEYTEHKDIILNKLKHILGCDGDQKIIGARKCEIKEIKTKVAKDFLNTYHIQGFGKSSVYLGAFYEDNLLGVMGFLEETPLYWNLTRFATNTNFRLPGIASKLFKYFILNYEYKEIKSFLDRRWNTEGNTMYEKLGFKLDKILPPDYYYVKGKKRYHKFGFRKERLNKKYGLPLTMTEKEMTTELGYYRIWNCGLVKYIWTNNNGG